MMTGLGWFAAGFGTCIGVVLLVAIVIDVTLVERGADTISRRTIDAGCDCAAVAAVVSLILGAVVGMLVGHLFLGQKVG